MWPTDVVHQAWVVARAGLAEADVDLTVARATISASPHVMASLHHLARGVLPRLIAAAAAFNTLAPQRR